MTAMAPIRATAMNRVNHSGQFGSQSAIRSPRPTPRRLSARAAPSACRASSAMPVVCPRKETCVAEATQNAGIDGPGAVIGSPSPASEAGRPVAQLELLHLAGRGLGQAGEDHSLRRLEMGEIVPAIRDDLGLRRLLSRLEGDESAGRFAPFLVRPGDHGGLQHLGMAEDHALDLDGRDILAAGDDDVLRAVAQFDIAVRVPDAEVAGMEPAAAEGLVGRGGVFQIALHHQIAPEEHLAHGRAVLRHRRQGFRGRRPSGPPRPDSARPGAT